MQQGSVYAQRLSESFRIETAPSFVAQTLSKAEIAVTDCRGDHPDDQVTSGLPVEDAYIVGLQLRDYPDCESWEQDRCVARTHIRAGDTHLYDLKRRPAFFIDKPFRVLGFYIPRAAFNAVADEAHVPRIGELDYQPGVGRDDEVIKCLGHSILAALEKPEQANRIFVDHVTLAVAAHVAHAYGSLRPVAVPAKGGLAAWQQKRACEMLSSDLDGTMAMKDIAAECGLSVSHFSRAFRESMGIAPHQWLIQRRVEVAKSLLRDRHLSLSEIAISAGFADQSHFTRVFSKATGVSPGIWRRCLEIGVADESC